MAALTKRHFVAFAAAIAAAEVSADERLRMAQLVADVAYRDNPRFDWQRFAKACGLTVSA